MDSFLTCCLATKEGNAFYGHQTTKNGHANNIYGDLENYFRNTREH